MRCVVVSAPRFPWAHFAAPATVTLGAATSTVRVPAPAGRWMMTGNPGFERVLGTVQGADQVVTHDPASGALVPVTVLNPGQGA